MCALAYPETDSLAAVETMGRGASAAERWYVGERCPAGFRVLVLEGPDVRPLRARTRDPLWSFSWGRSGSAARELAWSLLCDSAQDPGLADDWCSAFTSEVISLLPRDVFRMSSHEVIAWLSDERLGSASDRLLRHVRLETVAANGVDDRLGHLDVDGYCRPAASRSAPRQGSAAGRIHR